MEISSLKRLNSKRIKKILIGILLSDGSMDRYNRFDFFNKNKEYVEYVEYVLSNITNMSVKSYGKFNKRYNKIIGYRCFTKKHMYLDKLKKIFYKDRKHVTKYICDRLDIESFAHIWMCDGYLEHSKNRKLNKIQNIGWLCLEAFPPEELKLIQDRLMYFNIKSSLVAKPWGFGYRIRIGGEDLQRFISLMYPYILGCFSYKTKLYFKTDKYCLDNLLNTENIFHFYENCEDIVRHSQQ